MVVILFSCEKEVTTKEDECQLDYKNNYGYICKLYDNGIIDSTGFSTLNAKCLEKYNECKSK